MTKSQRLKPIVRLSVSKERDAAVVLAQAQKVLEGQEQRLNELLRYLDEYQRLLARESTGGVDVKRLHGYRGFIVRLNQTISYQRQQVEQARCEVEQSREAWRTARTRSQALDKAVAKHHRAEQQVHERHEQREADDRASRSVTDDED
ncbi:MAG: flagellar export protein FliJ [Gammaproteobacteria bacterium]|nr:MAG: flagellar export protein FliJ [Gammaproteobacteria bacterium]